MEQSGPIAVVSPANQGNSALKKKPPLPVNSSVKLERTDTGWLLFIVLPGLGETGITTPHKTFDEAIATVKGMFEVK